MNLTNLKVLHNTHSRQALKKMNKSKTLNSNKGSSRVSSPIKSKRLTSRWRLKWHSLGKSIGRR